MASISFPNHASPLDTSSISINGHNDHDQYYSPGFDTSSSFRMNPLSSHPPRTPKTSIISNSVHSYNPGFEPSEEQVDEHITPDDLDLDEHDEKVKSAEKRVLKEEVWREIILSSNGRDKAFKLIQYSIRVYLLFHASIAGSRLFNRTKKTTWSINLVERLTSTASGLSFTRKLLLLFNWLHPLTIIRSKQFENGSGSLGSSTSPKKSAPGQPQSFLQTALNAPPPVLLELINAGADDVATVARLGLIGKRTGSKAETFSDWCFFFATLVSLVENGVERQVITSLQAEVEGRMYNESMSGATAKSKPKISKVDEKELSRLRKQDYWLQVTRAKLVMDLIFVSYSVFNIKKGAATMTAFTGLASAVLSSAKLYEKHKNGLVKALLSSSS
ncbi:hypothetical protein FA13DRAFT_1684101 [Coprinellus micaceus]|uniref:Peroxisomal biogenesis factor 11 n=1 Tax=Coprinellus micaceus TaxID=71717 RepID=A0A4Y7TMZ5_COPMI|nr:hypothetical protein FA13DRAFT_1684101 [Coprinellus micaceus]